MDSEMMDNYGDACDAQIACAYLNTAIYALTQAQFHLMTDDTDPIRKNTIDMVCVLKDYVCKLIDIECKIEKKMGV